MKDFTVKLIKNIFNVVLTICSVPFVFVGMILLAYIRLMLSIILFIIKPWYQGRSVKQTVNHEGHPIYG